MRRHGMEITVGLIMLAILILGLAIAWVVYIESPRRASEYRQAERRAMIESIRTIRPVTTATFIALPDYDADTYDFTWNIQPIKQSAQTSEQGATIINADVHDDAVDLVDATINRPIPIGKNGKPLRTANQLMSANECQEHGVLGGDRTRRQRAVDYLCKNYNVHAINDAGDKNGVFYRGGGNLSRLILDMAVMSRPYPNQTQSTAV